MKLIMLMITCFFSLFMNGYIEEISKIENVIFEMYYSNFEDFLEMDDRAHLRVNENKVISYLESKGYKSNVYTNYDGIHIKIEIKYIYKHSKEYIFYMVKNNGD